MKSQGQSSVIKSTTCWQFSTEYSDSKLASLQPLIPILTPVQSQGCGFQLLKQQPASPVHTVDAYRQTREMKTSMMEGRRDGRRFLCPGILTALYLTASTRPRTLTLGANRTGTATSGANGVQRQPPKQCSDPCHGIKISRGQQRASINCNRDLWWRRAKMPLAAVVDWLWHPLPVLVGALN